MPTLFHVQRSEREVPVNGCGSVCSHISWFIMCNTSRTWVACDCAWGKAKCASMRALRFLVRGPSSRLPHFALWLTGTHNLSDHPLSWMLDTKLWQGSDFRIFQRHFKNYFLEKYRQENEISHPNIQEWTNARLHIKTNFWCQYINSVENYM